MTDIEPHPHRFSAQASGPVVGRLALPGDPWLTQLGLALSSLAVGTSSLEHASETPEVAALAAALGEVGVRVGRQGDVLTVHGLGLNGLLAPSRGLDADALGAAGHLLLGLLAAYPFSVSVGSALPAELLAGLGAHGGSTKEAAQRLQLLGSPQPLPFRQLLAGGDDAIKVALVLAALQAPGVSTLTETLASPDHIERMARYFGAGIDAHPGDNGNTHIEVAGLSPLLPRHLQLAGDAGSATFAILAALVVPGSDVLVENCLISPARTGFLDALLQMGGDIVFLNQREWGGENVADVRVRSSRMGAIQLDDSHAASLPGQLEALAVAAAFGRGETRIAMPEALAGKLAAGLAANGVYAMVGDGTLELVGGGAVEGAGRVAGDDAALLRAFAVLGLASRKPVEIVGLAPNDSELAALAGMGARFTPLGEQS
jgi:3-phosphoshikimate 1-carboxyvinyltransferase